MLSRRGRGAMLVAAMVLATGLLRGAAAGPAGAATVSFGANLSSATPTLDTANGATRAQDEEPLSLWNQTNGDSAGANADTAIFTPFNPGCTASYPGAGSYPGYTGACTNWMHSGGDNTAWNTGSAAGAPQGGQVRQVQVKGCAVEDNTTGNSQQSPNGAGGTDPANSIQFQTLAPQSNGSYKVDQTAGIFQLPFCSNSSDPTQGNVTTSTVTSFTPLHLCVNAGEIVSFYDLGGAVPDTAGGGYFYPQGVPFDVIAAASGDTMDSFVDSEAAGGLYTPGATISSVNGGNGTGWGQEMGEEVMLSASEGTVEDAYGLCPGGKATEPTDSNTITCVAENNPPAGYTPCPGYTGGSGGGGGGGGGGGTTGPTGPTGGSGSTKLIVGKLRLSKYAFKAKKGATITYQDNLAGATTLSVTKKGKSKVLWHSSHTDTPGLNTLKFLDKRLKKGFYTLTISTTYSGQPTRVNSVGMRIVT